MRDVCLFGDCRESMRKLIADGVRVQTCVTSPPYWGLRDYGTAKWEGGAADCDHRSPSMRDGRNENRATLGGGIMASNSYQLRYAAEQGTCGKCGARRIDSQLGLESTPEEYVANMVEVFRLVRDLLAEDGTLWLNLGDSYTSGGRTTQVNDKLGGRGPVPDGYRSPLPPGLKPKDLVGIPWRTAFALQADGWYLRSDIIWHKPNPMPESVTDRPTKAHEYLFLLSKSERYFYDADAIKEAATPQERTGIAGYKCPKDFGGSYIDGARASTKSTPNGPSGDTRNRRTVWTVATEPYSEAHFATFPTALIEPCILAGTSAHGHCPACGKGWVRILERIGGKSVAGPKSQAKRDAGIAIAFSGYDDGSTCPTFKTLGWQASCACALEPVPGIVFDPFLGSGTTAQVAQNLGRHWLGCELNEKYGQLQKRRTEQMGMALA